MTEALRSSRWFAGSDLSGILHRAVLRTDGLGDGWREDRPIIGVSNSWSELVNCNLHFRALSEAVRRGVYAAGGLPIEFPAIALGETLMKPTAMAYRNLMAMDIEESLRAYPFDGAVLIAGCDKSIPAQLMGAASANVPSIMITGGPADAGWFRGHAISTATDLWRFADDYRAGRMTDGEMAELEAALQPTVGHCNEMGTASTMAALVEALGMTLTGLAAIPATHAQRLAAAEACGARAVALARERVTPAHILTHDAFRNAITLLNALGGSTNAVIHLIAIAGRVGISLELDEFDRIGRHTPVLADVQPSGTHLFQDVHRAGGVPAILNELAPLLALDASTVAGVTLGEAIATAGIADSAVIRPFNEPVSRRGAIGVVRGNLAPRGAVVKASAASAELLQHRGPALVFEDIEDLARRVDDPALDVTADTVLVLRNAGPQGAPGMPEWGALPVPAKLVARGVRDIVRISDARMSGTAFGTVVLHISPEAAAGGPLAAVQTGDPIVFDFEGRRLDLDIPEQDLARRLDGVAPRAHRHRRGYLSLFEQHVLQADEGCDFDFLRAVDRPAEAPLPDGILQGWIGGW